MNYQVITWSVADPFGSLFQFRTRMEALRFIRRLAEGINSKLLEL